MPRILTSDQWADYLIFRLYPQQRVFFDGRSDFFGPAIGSDYRKLLSGESPWRELLDRYQFDLALLPHDWALSTALEREPGWRLVYRDPVAVLYARGGAGARLTSREERCHDGRHRDRYRPRGGRGGGGSAPPLGTELVDRGRRGRRPGVRGTGGWHGLAMAAAGAIVGFLVLLPFHWCGAMGGGDVKLMAAYGALLGPSGILLAALFAAVFGGLAAAGALLWKPRAAAIPYAPAIVLGAWVSLLGGGS